MVEGVETHTHILKHACSGGGNGQIHSATIDAVVCYVSDKMVSYEGYRLHQKEIHVKYHDEI